MLVLERQSWIAAVTPRWPFADVGCACNSGVGRNSDSAEPFSNLIPEYDYIFTYGGGQPVVDHYLATRAVLSPDL